MADNNDFDGTPQLQDDLLRDRARVLAEFLDDEVSKDWIDCFTSSPCPNYLVTLCPLLVQSGAIDYKDAIKQMLNLDGRRLIVNIDDLRSYNRPFAVGLLNEPNEYLPAFDAALKGLVEQIHEPNKHEIQGKTYYIGLRGSFGDHHVNPRTLRSIHLGKLMSLEGIVTRCEYRRGSRG